MASQPVAADSEMQAVAAQAAREMEEEERIGAVESLEGEAARSLLSSEQQHGDLARIAQEIIQAEPSLSVGIHDLKGIPGDILAAAAAAALPPQSLEPIPPRATPAVIASASATGGDETDESESDEEAQAESQGIDETVDDTPSAPPRTEHEPAPRAFADPLDVQLDGSVTMTATGSVVLLQKDQHSVIIQHASSSAAASHVGTVASGGRAIQEHAPSQAILAQVARDILDEGSLVALEPAPGTIAPRIIGRVREVFGNVSEPMYLVQLSAEQCTEGETGDSTANDNVFHAIAKMQDLQPGATVYSIAEFSSLVDPTKCRAGKPTDASNRYDEEASDSEFSDDEAEAAARKAAKSKRRGDSGVADMEAAAAAASTSPVAPDGSKRRRRTTKRRTVHAAANSATHQMGDPAATIAAQQAQIQALQAHLASMQQAMASGSGVAAHPTPAFNMYAPQGMTSGFGAAQQHNIQPANAPTGRVPSSAAQQFMAAAARAAASVAEANSKS